MHIPVLFNEAIEGLAIKPDGIYVDGTFGRGGHAKAILEKLNEQGRLIVFDKDPTAIAVAHEMFADDERVDVIHDSFTSMQQVIESKQLFGKVDGILLDLGVSSPQLDEAERGFSFINDGPLDMRMNSSIGMDAASWIKQVDESELARVLKEYGEERFAKRIARAIVNARQEKEITRTKQLAEIVAVANPKWERHKNPATRAFQAIRIFINEELDDLSNVLLQCIDVLAVGGRLAVISFHSLEDRIAKRFINKEIKGEEIPASVPVTHDYHKPRIRKLGKAIPPSEEEVAQNPRARSAKLRLVEKIL